MNNQKNLPEITLVVNKQGKKDLRCLNYFYQIKSMGPQSALYRCQTRGCYASLSLRTHIVKEVIEVFEPMVVTNLNFKHKVGCVPKTDSQFEVRSFLYKVKEKVKENPLIPTQQLYENQRTELAKAHQLSIESNESVQEDPLPIPMPDYTNVRDRFKRIRSKGRKKAS